MASRTKQKEEARARRLAEEQARAEQSRRTRRLQMLGGTVLIAAIIIGVAIAVSSGGNNPAANAHTLARQVHGQLKSCLKQDASVCSLLSGIPQSGTVLGNPNAKVTAVEYGDLECPVCRDFALSSENQLIANDVRSGKVKLIYRSLETATPTPSIFGPQQAAAYAAGLQGKAWYYIEFFYHQQGQEGTGYVTQGYLNDLAKQVPGLNFSKWLTDSKSSSLINQVSTENQTAVSHLTQIGATSQGQVSTPTIVITGPKGQAPAIVGDPTGYAQVESAIQSVQ